MRAALLVTIGCAACDGSMAPPVPMKPAVCETRYLEPTDVVHDETELLETSGIVASRRFADVLWAHNDSGDAARLFAIGIDGRTRGRLNLPGVVASDFEDLAAARCPDGVGDCLWIADTGNNLRDRDDLTIYVVEERAVAGEVDAPRVWTLPLAYPEGIEVDVEALVVTPDARALYLFEKIDSDSARVFGAEGPFVDGAPVTLTTRATFPAPGVAVTGGRMITGADLHSTEERLLVRVYSGVYEYLLPTKNLPMDLGTAEARLVALGPFSEPQGESVAYDHAGTGVWTSSEDRNGMGPQPLHHYDCE